MSLKLNLDDASETSPPLSRLGKTLQDSGAVLSDYAQQDVLCGKDAHQLALAGIVGYDQDG